MKQSTFFSNAIVFFLLYSSTCLAQFEWTALEPHNGRVPAVLTTTDSMQFIARQHCPEELIISSDAKNWELFYEGPFYDKFLNGTVLSRSSADGTLYLSEGKVIYMYDEQNKNLEPFIDASSFVEDIVQFEILTTGDVLLREEKSANADPDKMYHYDAQGTLVREISFDRAIDQLLVGDGAKHYVHSGAKLMSFDNEIDEFTDLGNQPVPLYYFDGRLFAWTEYSDDGQNWLQYKPGLATLEWVSKDGRVLINALSALEVSDYQLSSFTTVTYDPRIREYKGMEPRSFGLGGLYYEIYSYQSNDFELTYSENGIDNWVTIDASEVQLGLPFANVIEANNEQNVYVHYDALYRDLLHPSSSEWMDNPNQIWLESLDDGSWVNVYGHRSENGGLDWIEEDVHSNYDPSIQKRIRVKDGILYIYVREWIYRSFDKGVTWDTTFHDGLDGYAEINYDEHFWYTDQRQDFIYRSDYNGENVEEFDIRNFDSGVTIKTGYANSNVYFQFSSADSLGRFFCSFDGGATLREKDICNEVPCNLSRLHVDTYENVYLYGDKKIWMSEDEGSTWQDISPDFEGLKVINDIDLGHDGHLYLATEGTPVLRSSVPISRAYPFVFFVFIDKNGNCIWDADELLVPNFPLNIKDRFTKFTDIAGQVSGQLKEGSYELIPQFNEELFSSCQDSYSITLDGSSVADTTYVPISVLQECSLLEANVTTPFLRRCFENVMHIEVFNKGNFASENGLIEVLMDKDFEFVSSNLTLNAQQGDTMIFELPTIEPFMTFREHIRFELSCEAALGQAHYTSVTVEEDNTCSSLIRDSSYVACRTNVGSYDPNDKTLIVDGIVGAEIVNEDSMIEYLIRFQNTGTDTAFNIVIEDKLESYWNKSSIFPVAASHPYTWSIDRDELVFEFRDIQLVDSLTNEEDSHGFVKFQIALNEEELAAGDLIENKAGIYFDFNLPIVTNTSQGYYLCRPNSYPECAYRPFIEEDKHWIFQSYFDQDFGGIHRGFILNIGGDTIVNNKVYSKVMSNVLLGDHLCPDPPCFEPFFPYELGDQNLYALIREDIQEQKVYHLNHDADFINCEIEEYVLFDFSLRQNDSLHVCINEAIGSSQNPYTIIDSITVEPLFGQDREVFNTTGQVPIVGLQSDDKVKIIEGIGFETYGLFPGTLDELVEVCYGSLAECNIISSTSELSKIDLAIVPNPSTGKFEIRTTEELKSLTVYDLKGVELGVFYDREIDLSQLEAGLYFVRVQLHSDKWALKRVVKL